MDSTGFVGSIIHATQINPYAFLPIWTCLVATIVLTAERFIRLYGVYSVDGLRLMSDLQRLIVSGDIETAIRTCGGSPEAALPRVLKAGLQRASRDEVQIQNAVDAASLEVIPKLEKRLPYLALIANIATLFGLLGTIFGLIKAFAAVSNADPSKRQELLALGISEAMNATALGLVTAIFAMIAHSILSGRAQLIIEQIDEYGVKLIDLLSHRKLKHPSEKIANVEKT